MFESFVTHDARLLQLDVLHYDSETDSYVQFSFSYENLAHNSWWPNYELCQVRLPGFMKRGNYQTYTDNVKLLLPNLMIIITTLFTM